MTAYKLISVVEAFESDPGQSLGIEKCYAIVRYAQALGRGESAGALWRRDPMVELGLERRARLSRLTVRDVVEATRVLGTEEVPAAYVRRVQRATRESS